MYLNKLKPAKVKLKKHDQDRIQKYRPSFSLNQSLGNKCIMAASSLIPSTRLCTSVLVRYGLVMLM